MDELANYIISRQDISGEQKELWLMCVHMMDEEQARALLEQFTVEPDALVEMTENILRKQDAIRARDAGALDAIINEEARSITSPND